MSLKKQEREPGDDRPASVVPPKKMPLRAIPGEKSGDPAKYKPSTVRLVPTPLSLKERFSSNLHRLFGIVGLTRRDAAVQIGISYPLVKRLVSAGVSRSDPRNLKSLSRIAAFFEIENIEDLWHPELIRRLLISDDRTFVKKFQTRILAVREQRLVEAGPVRREELALMNRALGLEEASAPPLTGPYADKVAMIMASRKADAFRRVIDDYHDFVTQSSDNNAGKSNESRRTA
jgi:hypothetical protein